MTKRILQYIFILVPLLSSLAMAGVTLTDSGPRVLLENGLVSVEVEKDTGYITLLKNGSQVYIDSDAGKGKGYSLPATNIRPIVAMSGGQYSLVANTAEMADISVLFADSSKWPFTLDFHYVVQQDVRGVHVYCVIWYDPDFAVEDEVFLEAIGHTLRVDPDLFTEGTIGRKTEIMPLPYTLEAENMVIDATYRMDTNTAWYQRYGKEYYTKYNYTHLRSEFDVCGLNGGGYGFWVLQPGHDYLSSGPINYEAAFHQTDTTPVTFGVIHSAHKTSKTLYFNKSDGPWSKIYGPWFLYLNAGASREEMHQDAQRQYAVEQAAWPYAWMDHELYPLQNERGSVTGNVTITDGTSPQGAVVVLARTTRNEADHWEGQGMDYIYYAQADVDGNFTIDDIRSATYSLYIYADGVIDEYRQDGVTVIAAQNNHLVPISWTPIKRGNLLWQIGIPDRSVSEFRHGAIYSDVWGLWFDYPTDFPHGVHFTIGTSDESTDWNWAHCNVYTGNPDDGAWGLSPWYVYFDLAAIPTDVSYLTIAICGSRAGVLNIKINDHDITTLNDIYSDGAYIRCGLRGFNQTYIIPIEPQYLQAGANTLKLTQAEDYRYAGIYYDCLRFEVGIRADVNKDGSVDLEDIATMAGDWGKCTTPGGQGCVNLN